MKFLAIGTVRGQCCDYGWGTRGNTDYEVFEAESMEEAKKKIFEVEEYEDGDTEPTYYNLSTIKDSEYRPRGESLIIYAISDEFEFDVKAMQAQDAADRQAYREREQRKADELELARLQDKLGKKRDKNERRSGLERGRGRRT